MPVPTISMVALCAPDAKGKSVLTRIYSRRSTVLDYEAHHCCLFHGVALSNLFTLRR